MVVLTPGVSGFNLMVRWAGNEGKSLENPRKTIAYGFLSVPIHSQHPEGHSLPVAPASETSPFWTKGSFISFLGDVFFEKNIGSPIF